MNELALNFMSGSPVWLALLPLAVLTVVWWTYRHTYPPVSGTYRGLLVLLRVTAVVLLGLMVFEPAVLATRTATRSERVAILLDRSASMLLPLTASGGDAAPSRLARALEIAKEAAGASGAEVYAFGEGLSQLERLPGSAALEVEDRTDLAAALAELSRAGAEKWDRVLVVTDGAVNSGASPAEAVDSSLVVEAVLTGETPEAPDLVLAGMELARPVYSGAQVELDLALARAGQWSGTAAAVTICDFYLDGRKIAEHRISLGGTSGRFFSSRASFPAPEPGSYWLRSALRPVEGEWSALNNERLIRLDVQKNKRKAMFVSNSPDWDFTFGQRAVASSEDWEVEGIMLLRGQDGVQRVRTRLADGAFREGRLPEGNALAEVELAVLHGRIDRLEPDFLRALARAAATGGTALVFWPSAGVDFARIPEQLARYLPFAQEERAELAAAPQVSSVLFTLDRFNVLTGMGAQTVISGLPPVQRVWRGIAVKRAAEVLARLDRTTPAGAYGSPLIVAGQTGGTRSAGLLAQGFWRWHMLARAAGEADGRSYFRMWELLADWLVSGEKKQELVLAPERPVFGRGSQVRLAGRVLPQEDDTSAARGAITLTIIKNETAEAPDTVYYGVTEIHRPDGAFSISAGRIEPGVYEYDALYRGKGSEVAAGGQFAVESYSPEFSVTAPDSTVLAGLARLSGGKLYGPAGNGPQMQPAEIAEPLTAGYRPAFSEWSYLLIIGLLAVEWALRRRKALS